MNELWPTETSDKPPDCSSRWESSWQLAHYPRWSEGEICWPGIEIQAAKPGRPERNPLLYPLNWGAHKLCPVPTDDAAIALSFSSFMEEICPRWPVDGPRGSYEVSRTKFPGTCPPGAFINKPKKPLPFYSDEFQRERWCQSTQIFYGKMPTESTWTPRPRRWLLGLCALFHVSFLWGFSSRLREYCTLEVGFPMDWRTCLLALKRVHLLESRPHTLFWPEKTTQPAAHPRTRDRQFVSTFCKIQECLQAPDLTLFSWLVTGQHTGLSQTFTTTMTGLLETSSRLQPISIVLFLLNFLFA